MSNLNDTLRKSKAPYMFKPRDFNPFAGELSFNKFGSNVESYSSQAVLDCSVDTDFSEKVRHEIQKRINILDTYNELVANVGFIAGIGAIAYGLSKIL